MWSRDDEAAIGGIKRDFTTFVLLNTSLQSVPVRRHVVPQRGNSRARALAHKLAKQVVVPDPVIARSTAVQNKPEFGQVGVNIPMKTLMFFFF